MRNANNALHTLIKALDAELRYVARQVLRSLRRIAFLLLLQFFRRLRNGCLPTQSHIDYISALRTSSK